MKLYWGTRSPLGSITTKLALVTVNARWEEYVLLQELCPVAEHNHSRRICALLDRHTPAWWRAKDEPDGLYKMHLGSLEACGNK
ncbi:MAG: DUF45 domain-containing protein [Phenylobacterium sp.]|uniref:YgjP-like metallopeptidase domain-containing protein n=1 Tax=Phenylobacterium sp. TaxID=1871053 RepID=UPI003451819C|nr:DUF45 domain-containing protein [Phenylobacterium sp.]